MDASFHDDHGRPFAVALQELADRLGDGATARPTAERLLALMAEGAADFGRVRAGANEPALRLLALDGALTELLGEAAATGELTRADLAALGERLDRMTAPAPAR